MTDACRDLLDRSGHMRGRFALRDGTACDLLRSGKEFRRSLSNLFSPIFQRPKVGLHTPHQLVERLQGSGNFVIAKKFCASSEIQRRFDIGTPRATDAVILPEPYGSALPPGAWPWQVPKGGLPQRSRHERLHDCVRPLQRYARYPLRHHYRLYSARSRHG